MSGAYAGASYPSPRLSGKNFHYTRDIETSTAEEVERLMEEGTSFDDARYKILQQQMEEIGADETGMPKDAKTIIFTSGGSYLQGALNRARGAAAEIIGNARISDGPMFVMDYVPENSIFEWQRRLPRGTREGLRSLHKITDIGRRGVTRIFRKIIRYFGSQRKTSYRRDYEDTRDWGPAIILACFFLLAVFYFWSGPSNQVATEEVYEHG